MINAEVVYEHLSVKVDEALNDDYDSSTFWFDLYSELSDICSGVFDLDDVIGKTAKVRKDGLVNVVLRNTFKADMKKVRFLVEDENYNEYTIEINDWPRLTKKEVSFYCVMDEDTLENANSKYYFSVVDGSLEIELTDEEKQAALEGATKKVKPQIKADNIAVSKNVQAPTNVVEKSVSTKVSIAEENGKHVIEYPEYSIKCEGLEGYEDTLKLAETILAEIALNKDTQPIRGSLDYQVNNKDKKKEVTIEVDIEEYQKLLRSQADKTYLEFETKEEARARAQQPASSSLNSQNTNSGCLSMVFVVISVASTLALFVTF